MEPLTCGGRSPPSGGIVKYTWACSAVRSLVRRRLPQWKEELKPLWIGTHFPPCRKKVAFYLGLTSWIIWTFLCHIQRKCFLNSNLNYSLPHDHFQSLLGLSSLHGQPVSSALGDFSSTLLPPLANDCISPQQTFVDSHP